jgi:hypothetical protein
MGRNRLHRHPLHRRRQSRLHLRPPCRGLAATSAPVAGGAFTGRRGAFSSALRRPGTASAGGRRRDLSRLRDRWSIAATEQPGDREVAENLRRNEQDEDGDGDGDEARPRHRPYEVGARLANHQR